MHTLVVTTRRVVNKKSIALKAILEQDQKKAIRQLESLSLYVDLRNEESSVDCGIYIELKHAWIYYQY